MSTNPPRTDDLPAACAAFERLVNRVLDGDAPAAELASDPHASVCPFCRAERVGALFLIDGLKQTPVPVPPAGFAARATRAVIREHRRRTAVRWAVRTGAGALAASLVLAWLASPRSPLSDRGAFARWWPGAATNPATAPNPAPDPDAMARREPPETIQSQIGEAGSAVVALTRKATDDTLAPARNLFASSAPRVPPKPTAGDPPDPLADMPQAAKAGLEPLTNAAKRAVNLFVRDVGGATGAGKMKS
jgi:hypothetical protein